MFLWFLIFILGCSTYLAGTTPSVGFPLVLINTAKKKLRTDSTWTQIVLSFCNLHRGLGNMFSCNLTSNLWQGTLNWMRVTTICPKTSDFKSCTPYEWVEACREATSNSPLLRTPCVSEMSTTQLSHCFAPWWIDLRSIVKVQLLKSHFPNKSSWISANLGFLVINLMPNCSYEISPKPCINCNTTKRFICKLLAPKLLRSFCFCGVFTTQVFGDRYFMVLGWIE